VVVVVSAVVVVVLVVVVVTMKKRECFRYSPNIPFYLLAVCMELRRYAKPSVSHQAYKAIQPHVF